MDHAAASPIRPEALDAMVQAYREAPANPATLSSLGRAAAQRLEDARARLARLLSVPPDRLLFTSGGTESNNLGVFGSVPEPSGRHMVCSAIEHPSVLEAVRRLETRGAEVTWVAPDPTGVVVPARFAEALRPETRLACLMAVNNELGTCQPVAEVVSEVRRRAPRCRVLVDAVQAFGREPVRPTDWDADYVSLSAHKLGGPRFMGALVATRSRPQPLLAGGDQEWSVRPGTQDVAGAAGFAAAAEAAHREREAEHARVSRLRDAFEARVADRLPAARIHGRGAPRTPWIVSVSVPGIASEPLLRGLEEFGVVASAGAACHARSRNRSHVLAAIGVGKDWGTARFSFGRETTEADALFAADALAQVVARYAL